MSPLLLGGLLAVTGVGAVLASVCGPWWVQWWRARWTARHAAWLLAAEAEAHANTARYTEENP